MKQLVKRKKKVLVKRDKWINPVGYLEWKEIITTGLSTNRICLTPPNDLFEYVHLNKHKVPLKIIQRLEKVGILTRQVNFGTIYFRLGANWKDD